MQYQVYVGFSTSQVVEVEADDVESAMELAFDDAECPNASNRFEMDGDFIVHNVTDESGNVVWDDSMPDPNVPS